KPGWNGAPLTLAGSALLADGKSGKLSFKVSYLPAKSDLEFKVEGVPVVDWRAAYEKSVPVNVDDGQASLQTTAGVLTGNVDGKVSLRIDRLKVSARPGQKPILGLNAETSNY